MSVVPIIVLAGQSNASLAGVDNRIAELMAGGAYELVKVAVGGTSLFGNDAADWCPESGELFGQLTGDVRAAIRNVVAQGHQPQVITLWVHGEEDRQEPRASAYGGALCDFIDDYRAAIGAPGSAVYLSLLQETAVRGGQLYAADELFNVRTIETIGLETWDGVHYDKDGREFIADQFVALTGLQPVPVEGYASLLAGPVVNETEGRAAVWAPLFEDFDFVEFHSQVRLVSYSGDDNIRTGAANDHISTGGNNDRIRAGDGRDFVLAGVHDDVVFGEGGDDTLKGGFGNDALNGGAGNDRLFGEDGVDRLIGGTGEDRFVFRRGDAGDTRATADRIFDFREGDLLDFRSLGERFVGLDAFSGERGEVRFDVVGRSVFVSVDVNGDQVADLFVRLIGVDSLDATDFLF